MERAKLVCEAIRPRHWRFLCWTFAALLVSGALLDNTVFAPAPRAADRDVVDHEQELERQRQAVERKIESLKRELERLGPEPQDGARCIRLSRECIENPLLEHCRDAVGQRCRAKKPPPNPRLIFIDNPA